MSVNYEHRREVITTRTGTDHEVRSDGRTVWVNAGDQCLARFTPLSREYADPLKEYPVRTLEHRWAKYPTFTALDWKCFVEEVEYRFRVKIGPEHRPLYVPARCN